MKKYMKKYHKIYQITINNLWMNKNIKINKIYKNKEFYRLHAIIVNKKYHKKYLQEGKPLKNGEKA